LAIIDHISHPNIYAEFSFTSTPISDISVSLEQDDGTVNISKLVLGQLAVFPTESDTAVQDMAAAAAAHAG
jgi:hypothetical protein